MNLIIPFITALLLSLILTPASIILARKYGLVDDPKKHEHPAILHKKIVPRAGGLPIFLAFAIVSLLFIPPTKQFLGIMIGGLLLVLTGIADDKFDIKNHWKLIWQILSALIVVGFGIGITFITNPLNILGGAFGHEIIKLDTLRIQFNFLGQHSILVFADLFALFWIVWVINMVNFSSGVDGQLPGIIIIVLFVLFAAAAKFSVNDPSQITVSQLALIGAGATLGFLVYNFYPAKIFPGDSGSYFLGFLVAVIAILSGAKVGTAILVMAVPLIDGVFTVVRRIIEGKSPLRGDRKHLHHRLLALGWSQRRVALFYWLLCAILGAAALSLASIEKLFAGAVAAIIILGGLLWLDTNLPQKAPK